MPDLKNVRHELFCRGLVAGKTAGQAYQDAGYKASRAHASRLAAKGTIRQRVSELHQSVAQAATVDRAWVLAQMRDLYKPPLNGKEANAVMHSPHRALRMIGIG